MYPTTTNNMKTWPPCYSSTPKPASNLKSTSHLAYASKIAPSCTHTSLQTQPNDAMGSNEGEAQTNHSKWEEMTVIVTPELPDTRKKLKEITYSPQHSQAPSEPEYPTDHPLARVFSLRTVFVSLFLAIVLCLGCGLIALSYQGQMEIAKNLSGSIQKQLDHIITYKVNELFDWADAALYQSSTFFYDLKIPANGTNMFYEWPFVAEHMWSIVKGKKTGVEVEIDLLDNRFFGVDNFDGAGESGVDAYMFDYDTSDPNSNMTLSLWNANVSIPLLDVNFSREEVERTFAIAPPYPIYSFLRNSTRDYLLTCHSPNYWIDVYSFTDEVTHWVFVSVYGTICDQFGRMLGYMAVNIGISSIDSLLATLTSEYEGKIFIMDSRFQLVSTSTSSAIFSFEQINGTYTTTRKTVYNTEEQWIKDVFARINMHEGNSSKQVKINGTEYLLQVTCWNQIQNMNWVIVKLLDYNQFFGDSMGYVKKSIVISITTAAIAIAVVLLITYLTTRPLQILAQNMQKMARLDFDFDSTSGEPKLLEIKRLHHSFVGMNVALKSFKKFVPAQIISKILRSKKEVVAELHAANITIMFQDIEGFTSLSETMEPTQLAALTSEYMSVMTDIICKHGGTIDKYVGDCIMSLFNTPERVKNHPTAAAASAVECHLTLLRKNEEWKNIYGVEMHFRTGIHTGEVLLGNMGSDNRMNYTAFGDNVNIAARLEGVNKLFGTRIIVSKDVYKNFRPGQFVSRKLGKIRVSGKAKATTVYEVRAEGNEQTQHLFTHYESALKAFKNVQFLDAREYASKALSIDPEDKATLHLAGRIEEVMKIPDLPASWSYTEGLLKY